ncbi:hypothetical protein C8054_04320 [Micromonospora sp. RP3T]|nr:hypothetical protein C8054_04320 [Micromonospora sp. RP3T]
MGERGGLPAGADGGRRHGGGVDGTAPADGGVRRGSRWSFHPLLAWRNGTVVKGGEGDTNTIINVNHSDRRDG